jgi:hypothetical protein
MSNIVNEIYEGIALNKDNNHEVEMNEKIYREKRLGEFKYRRI